MKCLKHEPHASATYAGARGIIELRELVTVEEHSPSIGRIETRDQIEQR